MNYACCSFVLNHAELLGKAHPCILIYAGQADQNSGGKLPTLACCTHHQLPLCPNGAQDPIQQPGLGEALYLQAVFTRFFLQHLMCRQARAGREPNSCAAQQIGWTVYLSLVSHDPCPPAVGNLSDLWAYCICVARQWRS